MAFGDVPRWRFVVELSLGKPIVPRAHHIVSQPVRMQLLQEHLPDLPKVHLCNGDDFGACVKTCSKVIRGETTDGYQVENGDR